MTCLNRCWLSEVRSPDGLEQRVVESKVAKACDGPRRNSAGNMDSELVLQIYNLHEKYKKINLYNEMPPVLNF